MIFPINSLFFCGGPSNHLTRLSLNPFTQIKQQHRRTYGKDWIDRFRDRLSVDMGSYTPSEFECCLAVWC